MEQSATLPFTTDLNQREILEFDPGEIKSSLSSQPLSV
jgi:hypothetical protein